MAHPEVAFLCGLYSNLNGQNAVFAAIGKKRLYRRLLEKGCIAEKEGQCFITEHGKRYLDQTPAALPCAFKEFFLSRIPDLDKAQWFWWVCTHLDEESNVRNLREMLPEPELMLSVGSMESSPQEIAVFATGKFQNGSYADHLPVVLLSPHYDPTATISHWITSIICTHRKELSALLEGNGKEPN